MKKVLLVIVCLVIGGIAGFVAGMKYPRTSAYVDLTVVNNTARQINSITLVHEHGAQTVTDIKPQAKTEMKFSAAGETSYLVEVSFADGAKLNSSGRYAEDGYKITETINDNSITSDFHVRKS